MHTHKTNGQKKKNKNDLNVPLLHSQRAACVADAAAIIEMRVDLFEDSSDDQQDASRIGMLEENRLDDEAPSRAEKILAGIYSITILSSLFFGASTLGMRAGRPSGQSNQAPSDAPDNTASSLADTVSSLASYELRRDSHRYQNTFSVVPGSSNGLGEKTSSIESDSIATDVTTSSINAQDLAYRGSKNQRFNGGENTPPASPLAHRPAAIEGDELQAELQLINEIATLDSSFAAAARNKRAASESPRTNGKIERAAQRIGSGDAYPSNFYTIMTAIQQAVTRKMVQKKITDNALNSPYLVEFVKLLQADLDRHSVDNKFTVTYHYLYMALKETWTLGEKIRGENQPVRDYIRQMEEEMNLLQRQDRLPVKYTYANMEYSDIDLVAGTKINTYRRMVGGQLNEIVFHTPTGIRLMPFSQLYSPYHKDCLNGILIEHTHLKGDHTGIRDELLERIVAELTYVNFQEFRKQDRYIKFIELKAQDLLSKELAPFYETHTVLDRIETLMNIIDRTTYTPELVTDVSNQDLLQVLATMRDKTHDWNEMEMATAVQSLIIFKENTDNWFSGLDLDDVAKNGYVYRYTDDFHRTQYDSTTLVELLCISSGIKNIDIAKRKDVEVVFPDEYGRDFLFGKNKVAEEMQKFFADTQAVKKIAELKSTLLDRLPNIGKTLWNKHQVISVRFFVSPPDPSEEVTLIYTPTAGQNREFKITLGAILLGELAKQTYGDDPDEVDGDPEIFKLNPGCTLREYILMLKHNHIADKVMQDIDLAMEDTALEADYNEYAQLLISQGVKGRTDLKAKFHKVPLLHIYFERKMTAEECSSICKFKPFQYAQKEIPLTIFSMITGEGIWFKSMAEFNALYNASPDLRAYVKAHAFTDERKFLNQLQIIYPATSSLFQQDMNFFKTNFDKIATTTSESIKLAWLDFQIEITPYITAFISNGYLAAAVTVAIRAGSRGLQANILTHKDDRELLARKALAETTNTIIGNIAGMHVKNLGEKLFSTIAKRIPIDKAHVSTTVLQGILSSYSALVPANLPISLPNAGKGLAGMAGKKATVKGVKLSTEWAIDKVWGEQEKTESIQVNYALENSKKLDLSANLANAGLAAPVRRPDPVPIRDVSNAATSHLSIQNMTRHAQILRDSKIKRL